MKSALYLEEEEEDATMLSLEFMILRRSIVHWQVDRKRTLIYLLAIAEQPVATASCAIELAGN